MAEEEFINPIDKDHITENPGTLPYAHTRGGAVIRTTQESVVKSRAVSAMEEQTEMQLDQIRQQIELLARQAQEIRDRKELSLAIYTAKMSFTPLIGNSYYLYQKEDESYLLSMIGPEEWGAKMPYKSFVSQVKLLSDHTWTKI